MNTAGEWTEWSDNMVKKSDFTHFKPSAWWLEYGEL